MDHSVDDRQRQFEEYLRDGITAVKGGQHKLAHSLLNRAIYLNAADSRPYLWLSAILTVPEEQIELLEKAVALDPTNTAARRGLAVLKGKIDLLKLIPEGSTPGILSVENEISAESETFLCPRCGGRMAFSVLSEQLSCEYCGYSDGELPEEQSEGPLSSLADRSEQVLDFVIPTMLGHTWARTIQRLSCENCGAESLLPPGQKTLQCPYCSSNQVVQTAAADDLVDPQLIAVMKIDEKRAVQIARHWLGKGFFSPDNLLSSSVSLRLHPGYYSFWIFDGTVEIRWTCEVADGKGDFKRWTTVSGTETRFFDDVVAPGVKALDFQTVNALEPFNLEDVEEFSPDYLAGWPTILYNRSLADASLIAREAILKKLKPQIYNLIEPGREKQNVAIGGSQWSGMTYKHILLPLWIGEYLFKGKPYKLLINGQTGKVAGEKPRDSVKIFLILLVLLLGVVLIYLIYLILSIPSPH